VVASYLSQFKAYFFPVPSSATDCGELGSGSDTSCAISATLKVALSVPTTDGLKARTYMQVEFAASVPPGLGQVLEV
jgi:hypothetical protein